MILCDTNILIDFYKGKSDVADELHRIGAENIAISAITRAELYFGAFNKAELNKIRNHLNLLVEYPVDEAISLRFIDLMESFSLSHKLSIPDALIAATAIEKHVQLYTFNRKDFHFVSGLALYVPESD